MVQFVALLVWGRTVPDRGSLQPRQHVLQLGNRGTEMHGQEVECMYVFACKYISSWTEDQMKMQKKIMMKIEMDMEMVKEMKDDESENMEMKG